MRGVGSVVPRCFPGGIIGNDDSIKGDYIFGYGVIVKGGCRGGVK